MKPNHKNRFLVALLILFCGLYPLADTIPVPLREFFMGAITGVAASLLVRNLLPGEALNKIKVWKRRG